MFRCSLMELGLLIECHASRKVRRFQFQKSLDIYIYISNDIRDMQKGFEYKTAVALLAKHHGINMMCIYTNDAVTIQMAIVMATGTIMKSRIL